MFAAECKDQEGLSAQMECRNTTSETFLAEKGAQHLIFWIVQGHCALQVFRSREWKDTKILR